MTADWYDLGQRLRAANLGRAVPHLHHAPIVAVPHPVAVRAYARGDRITIAAATRDQAPASASGPGALDLLGCLGVTLTAATAATLVTDSPDSLGLLYRLALTATPGHDHDTVAAHIAWWRDRGDFPGGRAVADTLGSCRARWVTGSAPDAELDPATWRQWLAIRDDTTAGVLTIHERLSAGTPLTYLDGFAEADERWYRTAQSHHGDGLDWRRPDTRFRAAMGLRERCDAADLYAAALLTDPLHQRRAVHTGEVVTGTAHPQPGTLRQVEVTCARMDARLRIGTTVTGWAGAPGLPGPRFSATLTAATVQHRTLILTLSGTTGDAPAEGDPVAVLPAPPLAARLQASRSKYRNLYLTRRTWLTTGQAPSVTRRPVPLDVLIAGAEPG